MEKFGLPPSGPAPRGVRGCGAGGPGPPQRCGGGGCVRGGDTHTPTHGVGGSVELLGAGGDPSPRRGVSAVSAGEQESGGARVPQS